MVLFRCDAGLKHGLGHLSRCLTLADALAQTGVRSGFVIHAPEEIRQRVTLAGHAVIAAEAPIGRGDNPASWISKGVSVVVIDSKDTTHTYASQCRALSPIVCFDEQISIDLSCDVLVNNHIWARKSDYDVQSGRQLLIGSEYNTVHQGYFEITQPRQGLLITLGGEDPLNHTAWLIEALADTIGELPVFICIGPAHPDPDSIFRVCRERLPAAEVCISPQSLVGLAARCHIALSAGGTTCYELAAAGIASAVLVIEEHQERLAKAMVDAGASLFLGRYDRMDQQSVRRTFARLQEPRIVASLQAAGLALFRKAGASAIVAELQKFLEPRDLFSPHRTGIAAIRQRCD